MKTIERVKLIKKKSRDSSITPPRPKVKESLKIYNRRTGKEDVYERSCNQ